MKNENYLILVLAIFTFISCKAQIIPVEEHIQYINNEVEIPDGAHIKDINNKLDKFVGAWEGNYNNNNYEINIIEYTDEFYSIRNDILLMRYKVTNTFGQVLFTNFLYPDDSPLIVNGLNFNEDASYYTLYYIGQDIACGDKGSIYIIVDESDFNTLYLYFIQEQDIVSEVDCPDPEALEMAFPSEMITFTKQ